MLLFDENISYRIINKIRQEFPGSEHVTNVNPELRGDFSIFKYAQQSQLAIVTFDEDFYDLQTLHSPAPKIIWVRKHQNN